MQSRTATRPQNRERTDRQRNRSNTETVNIGQGKSCPKNFFEKTVDISDIICYNTSCWLSLVLSRGNPRRVKAEEICRYGGIGRRAWFRLHHVGELAKSRFLLAKIKYADMAELADAHGSGPCESNFMQVQVLLPAPVWVFITDFRYGRSFFFRVVILNLALQILCSLFYKTILSLFYNFY